MHFDNIKPALLRKKRKILLSHQIFLTKAALFPIIAVARDEKEAIASTQYTKEALYKSLLAQRKVAYIWF